MDRGKNIAQGARVTVIDPKEAAPVKLHVAAYARVSTDSEDQENSYIAQVDHYTRYIREHQEWELVDVYADEGLSGMETRRREEFNRMIADCRAGKIDRILVKSISRFARNQEDFILYMRELLRLGVSIRFEKENLDTGKISCEQVADIYGAFAQMETTSHSHNMRVSYRIQMEQGQFVPAKAPYGYRLENRQLRTIRFGRPAMWRRNCRRTSSTASGKRHWARFTTTRIFPWCCPPPQLLRRSWTLPPKRKTRRSRTTKKCTTACVRSSRTAGCR